MRLGAAGTSDRDDADYVVRGVPLDLTGSYRRGYGRAPARIREVSRSFEPYGPAAGIDLDGVAIHDAGDVDVWPDAEEVLAFAAGRVSDDVDAGAVPVLLGGEHTVSVAGLRGTAPDVFVSLDAHLDLRSEFAGERVHHACVTSLALEEGVDAVVAGARSGTQREFDRAASVDAVATIGADGFVASAVADTVPDDASIYLSVDLDVVDPGAAPGVGTPEPFGVEPSAVRDVVRSLAPQAVGFDVVECVPSHDAGEATVALAAGLVDSFLAHHASDPSADPGQ